MNRVKTQDIFESINYTMTTQAISLFNVLQSEGKVVIHSFNNLEVVKFDDILYVKAYGCYSKVFIKGRDPITSSRSFGEVCRLLSSYQLFQCHKSFAVNVSHVIRYKSVGKIVLENNIELPLARRRKEGFLAILDME